jgi:proteasome regulatory subunit
VPEPEHAGRQQILTIHTREMNLANSVDLEHWAAETAGFTGAELASLTTEAGMFAIRDGRTEVRTTDFEDAIEKVEADTDDSVGTPVAFN